MANKTDSILRRPSHQISGNKHYPIPEPEPVHLHTDADGPNAPEYEATELRDPNRASRILSLDEPDLTFSSHFRKFWRHHVRISVPHVDCRDHLANERTFLGYMRTSLVISMLGVFVEQLYRLNHSPNPNPVFGYYIISKPIAGTLQCAALGIVSLGAVRFWRQQSAMARGKVHAGGWNSEIGIVSAFTLLFLVAMLGVLIGIAVYRDVHHIDV